jgi:hypothetical protein
MDAFWLIAGPVLMGLAAVGAVIFLKTTRRLQGTRDPRHTGAVPVKPMSPGHAQRLRRRYAIAAGAVAGILALLALAFA